MSSTDKTRDKLMASMRKTKAGSTGKTAGGTSQGSVKKTASKTVAKKPARKPATTKAVPGKPARPRTLAAGGDPYQGGRRVWPD